MIEDLKTLFGTNIKKKLVSYTTFSTVFTTVLVFLSAPGSVVALSATTSFFFILMFAMSLPEDP